MPKLVQMSKNTIHRDPTNKVRVKKSVPNENSRRKKDDFDVMKDKLVNTLNARKDVKKNPVVVNKLTMKQKDVTKNSINIDSKGANSKIPAIKKLDVGLSSSKLKSAKEVYNSNIVIKDDKNSVSKCSATRIPMKASHAKIVLDNISSKNVMNQVHNVTISSPPSVRREIIPIKEENAKLKIKRQLENSVPRDRTRTRTLREDEILLLNKKSEPVINMNGNKMSPIERIERIERIDSSIVEVRPPISFEVKLEDSTGASNQNSRQKIQNDSEEYEDDFELYESDFETDISSGGQDDSSATHSTIGSGDSETDENVVSTASKHPFDMGTSIDNSEFESGSYEMKIIHKYQNTAPRFGNQQTEQQNDLGIEKSSNVPNSLNCGQLNSLKLNSKTTDNISDIEIEIGNSLDANSNKKFGTIKTKTKSKLSKRGVELLHKITLDIMDYVLFDFKPIPYELFMKIYGRNNMTQVNVQTHNDRVDQECQCDKLLIETSWTQCPITFYTKNISEIDFNDYKKGSGRCIDSFFPEQCDGTLNKTFEHSLNIIQNTLPGIDYNKRKINLLTINFEELNGFLVECELTLAHLHQTKTRKMHLRKSDIPISLGFFELSLSSICNGSEKVERIFSSSSLPGFLFTLHREMGTNLDIIALWSLSVVKVPTRLLSVWSHVVCIAVHPSIKNVIFAGLHDGSIAFWDISESKNWHPNIRKDGKRSVPTQITTPNLESNNISDIGPCVALQTLSIVYESDVLNGYNPKQICSLHECGLLILWTILHTSNCGNIDVKKRRINHQSLWGKVEVIQNKLIDLRLSISKTIHSKMSRPNSSYFDKTLSYFESELLNDTALRELQQMESVESKIITRFSCSDMKMTKNDILIITNENFFLIGRKSFKNASFRRIQIDTSPKVKIVHLSTLCNLQENMVLVALTDGSVKSLCCDLNVDRYDEMNLNVDREDSGSSSSGSSLTTATDNISQVNAMNSKPFVSYDLPTPSGSVQVAVTVPLNLGFNDISSYGKSCAIQNLVQSERRIYDESQSLSCLHTNEYKETSKRKNNPSVHDAIHSINFRNSQIVFSSSFEISTWKMLIPLMNSMKIIIIKKNRLCIIDPIKTETTEVSTSQLSMESFTCATTLIGQRNEEYLVSKNYILWDKQMWAENKQNGQKTNIYRPNDFMWSQLHD